MEMPKLHQEKAHGLFTYLIFVLALCLALTSVFYSISLKISRNVSWNRDTPAEKLSFTMRREFDRQKEETELIEQLRKAIESRLKMALPKDLASALTDGVVLCHLANHVRPRSVASIHVPSPAVVSYNRNIELVHLNVTRHSSVSQPKLTMARCRRNVDNFLDACRRIGVDEVNIICFLLK